jgi:hypothetical protein
MSQREYQRIAKKASIPISYLGYEAYMNAKTFTVILDLHSISRFLESLEEVSFYGETNEIIEDGEIEITINNVQGELGIVGTPDTIPIDSLEITKDSKLYISENGLESFGKVPDTITIYQINDLKNSMKSLKLCHFAF